MNNYDAAIRKALQHYEPTAITTDDLVDHLKSKGRHAVDREQLSADLHQLMAHGVITGQVAGNSRIYWRLAAPALFPTP